MALDSGAGARLDHADSRLAAIEGALGLVSALQDRHGSQTSPETSHKDSLVAARRGSTVKLKRTAVQCGSTLSSSCDGSHAQIDAGPTDTTSAYNAQPLLRTKLGANDSRPDPAHCATYSCKL